MPLAKVKGGPAILRRCRYYGNCSPWESQGRQIVTSEGRRGLFGRSGGARTCEAGARGAHRGEGRRGLRVVLKGTAPDLSHCAGAEALTKRMGRRCAAGGGARLRGSILAEVDPSSYFQHPQPPTLSRLRKREQLPHPNWPSLVLPYCWILSSSCIEV